jgi:excisionase family DNA binding protein
MKYKADLMTIREATDFLKVSRGTTLHWIRTGRLRAFKLGGGRLWRIQERDLRRFIRDASDA